MNGSVVKFAYMWSVYIFAHEKLKMHTQSKAAPFTSFPIFHSSKLSWVSERGRDNVSLTSLSPPSTRTKGEIYAVYRGNFLIFSQNHFSCCRVENTPTLAVYSKTGAVKKKENCFLIMERQRRVRREFFH